jgi:hypothetical protein
MGRPKLPKKDKKIDISITLSKESISYLNSITKNKSQFIENLININKEKQNDNR